MPWLSGAGVGDTCSEARMGKGRRNLALGLPLIRPSGTFFPLKGGEKGKGSRFARVARLSRQIPLANLFSLLPVALRNGEKVGEGRMRGSCTRNPVCSCPIRPQSLGACAGQGPSPRRKGRRGEGKTNLSRTCGAMASHRSPASRPRLELTDPGRRDRRRHPT